MEREVDSGLDRLCGWLLPPRCVLCDARGQPPCLDLCGACEADLGPAGSPTIAAAPLRHVLAAFGYGHPVDQLVQALKYGGQLATGRVLGTLLGRRVRALGLDCGVDVVIPVPLHPERHAGRGFNQSAEIARWAVRTLDCPVDATLATRTRRTPPQVGQSGPERRTNLVGAFAARPRVRGLHVAIVDDVTTTGGTLGALAVALAEAGAATIDAWCIARAPSGKQVDLAS